VQERYPDAHLAEIVTGAPHFCIEAEHEDYLLEFADAETGHLMKGERPVLWECIVYDTDGVEVFAETRPDLAALVEAARVWCLDRVDGDRVEQADDPDRAHDSRET
jgi:hypothetical protein